MKEQKVGKPQGGARGEERGSGKLRGAVGVKGQKRIVAQKS